MSLPVTHHSEHHTISAAEAIVDGAPGGATHVAYWLSEDAQGDKVVGWGDSADAALQTAQRECQSQGILSGALAVYDVE